MSWADVNPLHHELDLEAVREVLESLLSEELHEDRLRVMELRVHHELMARFGYWIQGWRWGTPLACALRPPLLRRVGSAIDFHLPRN